MRDLTTLDEWRLHDREVIEAYGWAGDGTCGAFSIPSPIDRQPLIIVASANGGWDHVSVSRKNRVPNWAEMEHVARLFFGHDEVAMQLHLPASEHINVHPNCLHWWRCHATPIPLPPKAFV